MAEQKVDLGKAGHFTIKKGALRGYIQRHYGKAGFNPDGTIKDSLLHRLAEGGDSQVARRARTALGFKAMKH
jgi:hypothetical protein